MRRSFRVLLLSAALLLPAVSARADCAFDIAALQSKVAKPADAARFGLVRKELGKADESRASSETECRNHVARAWRAFHAVAPEQPIVKNAPAQVRYE